MDVQYVQVTTVRNAPRVILDSSYRKMLTHALTSVLLTLPREQHALASERICSALHSLSQLNGLPTSGTLSKVLTRTKFSVVKPTPTQPMIHGYTDPWITSTQSTLTVSMTFWKFRKYLLDMEDFWWRTLWQYKYGQGVLGWMVPLLRFCQRSMRRKLEMTCRNSCSDPTETTCT